MVDLHAKNSENLTAYDIVKLLINEGNPFDENIEDLKKVFNRFYPRKIKF